MELSSNMMKQEAEILSEFMFSFLRRFAISRCREISFSQWLVTTHKGGQIDDFRLMIEDTVADLIGYMV